MHTKSQITLEDAKNVASRIFGLIAPFGFVELKKAYRRESLRLHPDTGGDKQLFQEMNSAYEQLSELQWMSGLFTHDKGEPMDIRQAVTLEGIPLSKLGLGLGPTINGSGCELCNHNGYTTHFGRHLVTCNECDVFGRVPLELECKFCNGTGKFRQCRTERLVDCRACRGSGIFKHPFRKMCCLKCRGTKARPIDKGPYYMKCYCCNGTGEKKVFNPVILKGAVMF